MKLVTSISVLILSTLIFISTSVNAQSHTSYNNRKGIWSEPSTWYKSHAYLKNVPGNDSGATINIYGVVTSSTSLIIGNNVNMHLYDTLIIDGNFTLNGGARFTIHSTGVLIVRGNYTTTDNSRTNNYGKSVVTGNITAMGSSQVHNHATFYAFNTNVNNGGIITGFYGNEQNLIDTNKPLYNLTMFGSSSLPIVLVYFTAKSESSSIQLAWATSSESNFDFFTVERTNDLVNWNRIGEVSGAGNSTSIVKYSFTDAAPVSGKAYYRLKATDFDGSVEYHEVIAAQFSGSFSTSIFPNPSNGESLNLDAGFDKTDVRIFNMAGKEVYKNTLHAGKNEINFTKSLDRGFYVVSVRQGGVEQKLKFQVN